MFPKLVASMKGIIVLACISVFTMGGCARRAYVPHLAEHKCPDYAARYDTVFCHAVKGQREMACDTPISVCVAVDERGNVSNEAFPLGADPADADGDEGAKADRRKSRPCKGPFCFMKNGVTLMFRKDTTKKD